MEIRILVADDHSILREGLRFVLEHQPDMRVVGEAADGETAIRLAHTLTPDVVLMDVEMPGMTGVLAARRIREANAAIQVVIFSIHGDTENVLEALDAGVKGYLLKECESREVVSAVRAARAGRRYLSQGIAEAVVDAHLQQRGHAASEHPLDRLSARERDTLRMVASGKSSAEIAEMLLLSIKTVETYRSRLMQKLDIHDVPTLVKFAIQHGLASLE